MMKIKKKEQAHQLKENHYYQSVTMLNSRFSRMMFLQLILLKEVNQIIRLKKMKENLVKSKKMKKKNHII